MKLHSGLKDCNFDTLYSLKVAAVTAIQGHGPF